MVQAHVKAGALTGLAPDDLTYPLAPPPKPSGWVFTRWPGSAPTTRLPPRSIVNGQPVSNWWPVAYALQRVGDVRAAPALLALVNTPGRFTASFAVRGLGSSKATQAAPTLRQIVEQRQRPARRRDPGRAVADRDPGRRRAFRC